MSGAAERCGLFARNATVAEIMHLKRKMILVVARPP